MAKDSGAAQSANESGLDRLKSEAAGYLGASAHKLAGKAGEKVSSLTGGLTDVAENGGKLPKIGARLLGGESPVKAFVSEKAKSAKDSAVDTVKSALGAGGGRKAGDIKVTNIVETIDIGLPRRTVYDHWTQLEEFSSFTKGVQSVKMSDEVESDWKVRVAFSDRSWTANIEEQVPDQLIRWSSEGSKATTTGVVSFHALTPTLTRVVVVVEYTPSGFFEKTGNLWRAQGRRLRLDLKHFQRYITLTEEDEDFEGWRGEIRDGEVVMSHEEGVEEDERQAEADEDEYDEDDYDYDEEEEEEEEE